MSKLGLYQTMSDLKFSKVLLSTFYLTRNTIIFDGKVKVDTHIEIISLIRFK